MSSDVIQKSLQKRYRSEKIFKYAGVFSIAVAVLFLSVLFIAIIYRGAPAFITHKIGLEIDLGEEKTIDQINYRLLIKESLKKKFPDAKTTLEKANLYHLVSKIAHLELKNQLKKNPELLGKRHSFWLSVSSDVDMFLKGKISKTTPNEERKLKNNQIAWIENLQSEGKISGGFNWNFFKYADSAEPEVAGMSASIAGSFFVVIVFLLAAFPIGVMSAFYLEEFAKKNVWVDILEVSINNLAAIPSIIFGLLGLVVYLNFMHLPRSSAIVGGLTLSMLVLPVIIISTRNSIKTIPQSIKDAAIAMGASKVQVMFHHTLPLSLPGIMTGTILAVSRALGETAPLLMIGMVAFIADVPHGLMDPATAMPVQIYLWSDSPELGFAEKSAAAIMVLLMFLISFNAVAVYIRKKFEKKW
ncbi:MAG: pstA2 [Rickettsiaceae bacterium]|jgi:phosphate transport system permease protein|nr:pstA2 [Rickettsiaceae bacterium]